MPPSVKVPQFHFLYDTANFRWRLSAPVSCSIAANIEEHKSWTQSEFCTSQNSVAGQESGKCIYSVPVQETAKHRAKFGWPPSSAVAAVTKLRCDTDWNYLGCPKLPVRSQPLVGRSSPYCGNMWTRFYCLTNFFPIVDMCLSCEDIADKVVPWCANGVFCVLYFSASPVQRVSDRPAS